MSQTTSQANAGTVVPNFTVSESTSKKRSERLTAEEEKDIARAIRKAENRARAPGGHAVRGSPLAGPERTSLARELASPKVRRHGSRR